MLPKRQMRRATENKEVKGQKREKETFIDKCERLVVLSGLLSVK